MKIPTSGLSIGCALSILLIGFAPGGWLTAQEPGEKPPAEKDGGEVGEKKSDTDKQDGQKEPKTGSPGRSVVTETKRRVPVIPLIPRDQLPRQTRVRPDPRVEQYRKGKVYVRVAEKVGPMKGEEYEPEVPVIQNYLKEYFRRAGYDIASKTQKAIYRIEGTFDANFLDVLTFRGETIAWKYRGGVKLEVRDSADRVLEKVEIPDYDRENVKDEKTCVLDMRRYLAKALHDKLFEKGKIFTDKKVVKLVENLLVDPLEADDLLTGDEIIARLADMGFPAVSYLLEALTDDRTVLAATNYPGLQKLDDLKVYHVADKALEEIFQKISRMDIRSDKDKRYIITLGWENEWRRFCPPFRDSPEHKLRMKRAAARRARKEAEARARKVGESSGGGKGGPPEAARDKEPR